MIRLLRSIIGLVLALPEGGEVVPRDSLQAHHPTQKPPGPYPRQEGSSVTVPKSLPRLCLDTPLPGQEKQKRFWRSLENWSCPSPVRCQGQGCHLS